MTPAALLLAASFYLAPWPWLYVPALTALALVIWRRPDLGPGLVVLFAPFFPVPKHIGAREFAPSEIFLLLSFATVGVRVVMHRHVPVHWSALRRSAFVPPLLLFVAAATASTVLAIDRHHALQEYRTVILEPACFFALVVLLADRPSWRHVLIPAALGAGVLMSGLGLVQFVTHQNLSLSPGTSVERVRAVYGSADNLALLLDRVIPVAFALAIVPSVSRSVRLAGTATCIVCGLVMLLTFTRGGWLAVAVACLALLALEYPWGRWVAAGAVLVALAVLALAGARVGHALQAGHTGTIERRLDLWRSSMRMLRHSPIVGVGPDNFLHYYAPTRKQDPYNYGCAPGLGYMEAAAGLEPCLSHPHNEVLDFWLSTGLAGLAAFVWLEAVFWEACVRVWRSGRDQADRALLLGAGGAMLAALGHGLVDNSYFLPDLAILFWFLCAMVVQLRGVHVEGGP